jgi:GTP-binding protein
MMKPVLALIGRPNVGKSTLFNRLTRSRDALVADFPGLTRDRKYGTGDLNGRGYLLIDTGGLSGEQDGIDAQMFKQTQAAIQEAHAILFIVDGKQGMTAADESIAQDIRATGKPIYLLVNKIDRVDPDQAAAEFYALGFTEVFMVAAIQGRGVTVMMEAVLDHCGATSTEEDEAEQEDGSIRIAFVGRPNVGKSTLVNRIMGEERVIAFDQPGTTRDSIFIPFERDGQKYTLIDTAGVRRRSRVDETIEKFSIIKTLDAIQRAHVVIMLVDAHDVIADQDAHLLGLILDAGKALILAVNKWDGLESDQRDWIKQQLEIKLPFISFAETYFISALHGSNVGLLYAAVKRAYDSAMMKVPTPRLTRILEMAIQQHQPPLTRGQRIKLRYAHQGGSNPFRIIIHGNRTDYVPEAYTRYLANYFRQTLKLTGTQLRIEYKSGENPYEGKHKTLTPRQEHTKKRQMARVREIKKSEKKKK